MKRSLSNSTIFIVILLLTIFREPLFVLEPHLWHEEGAVYFLHAYSHPWWQSLFMPHMGYYSLIPNVATVLSFNILGLENAPSLIVLIALAVQMIPFFIICFIPSFFWLRQIDKVIIAFIVLLAPNTHEVWLSTITSQYYLAIALTLLLCSNCEVNRFTKITAPILTFIGGLSGAVVCFLTPIFIIKAFRNKTSTTQFMMMIMMVCTFLQLVAIVYLKVEGHSMGSRLTVEPFLLPSVFWVKNITLPLLGEHLSLFFSNRLLWALDLNEAKFLNYSGFIVLSLIGIISFLFFRVPRDSRFYFVGSFLLLMILSVIAASDTKWSQMHTMWGLRYSFAPNVILVMMIYLSIRKGASWANKISNLVLVLFLVSYLVNGAWMYYRYGNIPPDTPLWREEVRKWREDPAYEMAISPLDHDGLPWRISLKPK